MKYNLKLDKPQKKLQCFKCKYYGKDGLCKGMGKCCFGYDSLTKSLIDPVTNLPLTENAIKTIKAKLESEE